MSGELVYLDPEDQAWLTLAERDLAFQRHYEAAKAITVPEPMTPVELVDRTADRNDPDASDVIWWLLITVAAFAFVNLTLVVAWLLGWWGYGVVLGVMWVGLYAGYRWLTGRPVGGAR